MKAPMLPPVAFLLAEEADLATIEGLDPDSHWVSPAPRTTCVGHRDTVAA
jgi:hypothetical protein